MPTPPKPAHLALAFRRRGLVVVLSGLLVSAVMLTSGPVGATSVSARRPVPQTMRAGGRPIVVVWMENHTARQITKRTAPFMTSLKRRGRYFANYHGVTDPSLPNYLAFASGSTKGKSGTDSIHAGEISGRTIWRQLGAAGVSWGVYQESMPGTCYTGSQASNHRTGPYVLRHNPATSFAEIAHSRACRRVKPLGKMTRKLPHVSFVTPAICNDMHGVGDSSFGAACRSGSSAVIRRGDQWLHRWVPRWRKAGATVIITFDEGSSALYTIVVGSGVRRSVDHHVYNHYSLLASLERRFHLPRLGGAQHARPMPIGP
jgi:phosphatidylinositol-3-phosphatase